MLQCRIIHAIIAKYTVRITNSRTLHTHGGHTMSSLINKFIALFQSTSYTGRMESYVVSRNPQSINDVERAAREFDRVAARGL